MVNPAVPAGCWDLDLATGSLALCGQSRAMFGLGPDASDRLTETEWASRFHPDDLPGVRKALTASLVQRAPYAERFRAVRPDGSIQLILGIGRPLDDSAGSCRFVGWNFDVVSTGEIAVDWILAHPEAFHGEHPLPSTSSSAHAQDTSSDELTGALLERAQSILRVRAARERMLGRAAIGEPAFDLLLRLYLRTGHREASLTSLARAADIPYSSAIRWTRFLADRGYVECIESRSDRRAYSVHLTSAGRAIMDEFLSVR